MTLVTAAGQPTQKARRAAEALLVQLLVWLLLWLGAAYFLLMAGLPEGLVARLAAIAGAVVLLGLLVGSMTPAASRAGAFLRYQLPVLPLAATLLWLGVKVAAGLVVGLVLLAWKLLGLVVEIMAALEGMFGGGP